MSHHSEVMVLGSNRLLMDERRKIIGSEIYPRVVTLEKLKESNKFCHGSMFYRRAIFENGWKLDGTFRYSDDYELWVRVLQHHIGMNLDLFLYADMIHKRSVTSIFLGMEPKQYLIYRKLVRKIAKGEIDREEAKSLIRKGIREHKLENILETRKEKIFLYAEWAHWLIVYHLSSRKHGIMLLKGLS